MEQKIKRNESAYKGNLKFLRRYNQCEKLRANGYKRYFAQLQNQVAQDREMTMGKLYDVESKLNQ